MSAVHRPVELAISAELSISVPPERGDAARNRRLILDAARTLIAEHGADGVTTEDIAEAAGVGKGTVFRRFGSRAGLMMVLLDEDEQALQHAFMFGPPPLGPGAPPLERLIAFGHERLTFVERHRELLSETNRAPEIRYGPPYVVSHTHVRLLLSAANSTGDLDAQADALLALLDTDYIAHQVTDRGRDVDSLRVNWDSVARKLCGQ